jgi:hypothetical protein
VWPIKVVRALALTPDRSELGDKHKRAPKRFPPIYWPLVFLERGGLASALWWPKPCFGGRDEASPRTQAHLTELAALAADEKAVTSHTHSDSLQPSHWSFWSAEDLPPLCGGRSRASGGWKEASPCHEAHLTDHAPSQSTRKRWRATRTPRCFKAFHPPITFLLLDPLPVARAGLLAAALVAFAGVNLRSEKAPHNQGVGLLVCGGLASALWWPKPCFGGRDEASPRTQAHLTEPAALAADEKAGASHTRSKCSSQTGLDQQS